MDEANVDTCVRANVVVVAVDHRYIVGISVRAQLAVNLVGRLVRCRIREVAVLAAVADLDLAREDHVAHDNAVVVVVVVVVCVRVANRARNKRRWIDGLTVYGPDSLSAGHLDLVGAAEDALEEVLTIVAGHGARQRSIGADLEELDGYAVDARLAKIGHAVFVAVEPDEVANSVHGLGEAAGVGECQRCALAVTEADALYLRAKFTVACADLDRCFVDVRSPRCRRIDLWDDGVVDRCSRSLRRDSYDSVNDRCGDSLGSDPPLDALGSWGTVAAAGVDTHDSCEGRCRASFESWRKLDAGDVGVLCSVADLVGEGVAEEGEFVAFEQLKLDLG